MRHFIARHADKITGVISGFDRIVFRGVLRGLCYAAGVGAFLRSQNVLLKDFGKFVESTTAMIRDGARDTAKAVGIPIRYLEGSGDSKDQIARTLLAERPNRTGPICLLSTVDPCWSWRVWRSAKREHRQDLRRRTAKCLHFYHYFSDPELGFGHVRIQTWMPYSVQICLNGREWLARQLQRSRLRHTRVGNCFPRIASPDRAQRILHGMVGLDWPSILNDLVLRANPAIASILHDHDTRYYWTVHQAEWATDVMFRDPSLLASCYPSLVRHAITDFGSRDVLRFLGKRNIPISAEVTSEYKHRIEGVRVRHLVRSNSIKMYDKATSVLRVETTVNRANEFKVRRKAYGDPSSPSRIRQMRRGVVDIRQLAHVAQGCNDRYLDALSVVSDPDTIGDIVLPATRPSSIGGRRVRGLKPWADPDLPLLKAIAAGEFFVNGFRNRDLLAALFPGDHHACERKRLRGRVTRLLRLLRAHEIIEKVPGTHRYHVTDSGRRLIAAVVATNTASLTRLKRCA